MCLIKQPLCSWINLSRGLSYGPVSLFIILALSDKKKCDVTPTQPCSAQNALCSMYVSVCIGDEVSGCAWEPTLGQCSALQEQ